MVGRILELVVRRSDGLVLGGMAGLVQARRQVLALVLVERRTKIPTSVRRSSTVTALVALALAGLALRLGTNERRRVVAGSSLEVLAVGGKSGLVVVVVGKLVVVVGKPVVVVGKSELVLDKNIRHCQRTIHCLSCCQRSTMNLKNLRRVRRRDFRDRQGRHGRRTSDHR